MVRRMQRLRWANGFQSSHRAKSSHRATQTNRIKLLPAISLPAVVVAGALLAGCATSHALALAQQACTHVDRSVAEYELSLHAPNPANATYEQSASMTELRYALQPAALAAGQDPHWQALMTTISESSRIPEGNLITALQAQCQSAQHPGDLLPSQIGPGAPPGLIAPSSPQTTTPGVPQTTTPQTSSGAPPTSTSNQPTPSPTTTLGASTTTIPIPVTAP